MGTEPVTNPYVCEDGSFRINSWTPKDIVILDIHDQNARRAIRTYAKDCGNEKLRNALNYRLRVFERYDEACEIDLCAYQNGEED